MVRRTLEKSPVYQRQQSEEIKKTLANVGLRVGIWIMQNFPEKRIKRVSFQFALSEFKTAPMWEKKEEGEIVPTVRDYFAEELEELITDIQRPRQFLNGLFKGVYFELGGREFAS